MFTSAAANEAEDGAILCARKHPLPDGWEDVDSVVLSKVATFTTGDLIVYA